MTITRSKFQRSTQYPFRFHRCIYRLKRSEEKEDPQQSKAGQFTGPASLKIKVLSTRGPFAGRTANLPLSQSRFFFTNIGQHSLEIVEAVVDPLHHSETGIAAESSLAVEVGKQKLAPGEHTMVTVSGLVPSAPSVYTSTLRITPKTGTPLATGIELIVKARSFWGFACILLGLMLVGIINTLDSESGIQGDLRRALLARQEVYDLIQQRPPPHRYALLVGNINRRLDATIAALQEPRTVSFVDYRATEALEQMQTTTALIADLRSALSAAPLGEIEITDLVKEWGRLQAVFKDLSNRFLTSDPPASGDSLQQRLIAFNSLAAQRILGPLLASYMHDFPYQINRVKLLREAGRLHDAASQAVSVRRWMQRAADVVKQQVQLLAYFQQISANNLATEIRIRKRLETTAIGAVQRAHIIELLEQAAATLKERFNWQAIQKVNQRILKAREELTRAEAHAVLTAAKKASVQESKESSLEGVEAVLDQGAKLKRNPNGKVVAEEKTAWLRRVATAWDERLSTLPKPVPQTMFTELEALKAAIESNNLNALSNHIKGLLDQWTDYSSKRAQLKIQSATIPLCLQLREDLFIDLEATRQVMRRLDANPNLLKWERQHDRLLSKIKETPDRIEKIEPDCLETFTDLSTASFQLSNEVDNVMWNTALLPYETKRQIATELGTLLSPDTLHNLISNLRQLHINVQTHSDEIYEGRQVSFEIGNLNPTWGPGVMVAIDFGDDSQQTLSAETLQKTKSVMHVYKNARSVTITVKAAESFKPGTTEPIGAILGEGELYQLSVAPSPVTAKRKLADNLFNVRFGLALLIAAVLYFGQFYTKKAVFGESRFDYVQALALGFAVSVAVNNLPQAIIALFK